MCRRVSLRKYTRSSYVYTSDRIPKKEAVNHSNKMTPKSKDTKTKTIRAEWKRRKIVFSRVVISLHCQLKWIWNYLTPVCDRPSREVYSVGKIGSESGLSHPKIWILGWKKERKEEGEHQHAPALYFLTLDTMWPAASYSYHDSLCHFFFCSQSFSALLDCTFKSSIPINPFSVSSFS